MSENFSFFKNFPQSSKGSERRDSKKEKKKTAQDGWKATQKFRNDQIFKESRMSRNPTNDGYTNPEKEVEIHRVTNRERNRPTDTRVIQGK